MSRFRYCLLLAGCALTSPALAQQGGPSGHWSTLVGAVVDSLHAGPLTDATVVLDGTALSATTDAQGKFRLDSIPPGTYRIVVFHPMLDTLGFSVGTIPLRMGADSVRQVLLGTPSAQTLVTNACPAPKRRLGPAAIMGRVLDPDTHAPLAGVRVSVVWSELAVGKDVGVRRVPQVREGRTDANGAFVICGVKAGIQGTLEADRGRAQTAEVPIDLGESLLELQTLTMTAITGTDSTLPQAGKAVLTGRVVDQRGLPVENARITVQGATATVSTGKDGAFRLAGLPSGTRAVLVRSLGYSPSQLPVQLSAAKPATLAVQLQKAPPTLPAVHVESQVAQALKDNGFEDRRRMGMGYYLGPEDIARRQPQQLSSLFPMIPGFQLRSGAGTGMAITSVRDGCVSFWVDGVPWKETNPGDLDYQLQVDQLMAVETYSAAAAPLQYKVPGQSGCSVVLLWTNRTVGQQQQKGKQ